MQDNMIDRWPRSEYVGVGQGEEQIDDWELWGDPKEIERRKAERARNAMHPEARKELVRTHLPLSLSQWGINRARHYPEQVVGSSTHTAADFHSSTARS